MGCGLGCHQGVEMPTDSRKVENLVDVMFAIHEALRAQGERIRRMAVRLPLDGSLQPFKAAFSSWASALEYHAEKEDSLMTGPLADSAPARENELSHRRLEERMEDVLTCLNEEIGRTHVISRTRRHLYERVVALQVAQNDHLEEEEEFVMPIVREQISQEQQMEIARRLVIDEDAEDRRWVLTWMAHALRPEDRHLVRDIRTRFSTAPL